MTAASTPAPQSSIISQPNGHSYPPTSPPSAGVSSAVCAGHIRLTPIPEALEAFKRGECLLVLDDLDRENEGDLVIAAEHCSTEKMAWIIRHSSGFICIAMAPERLDALELPMMVHNPSDPRKTAYTHTVDYRHGTTTGISAHDRALTARSMASPKSTPSDFSRPGHLCPLRAMPGGVLSRTGHTEAGVDLCVLSGLSPAAVICELVKPDDPEGSMARRDDCHAFAVRWGIKMITIEDLVKYRLQAAAVPEAGEHRAKLL